MQKETKDIILCIIFIILYVYLLRIIKNNRKIKDANRIEKLETEIELPDIISATLAGTTDSPYPREPLTFATTCYDLRFKDEEHGFLTKIYGKDLYDSFILPGTSLALFDRNWSSKAYDEVSLIDKAYYNSWCKTLLIAKTIHNIKTIAIVDHEDCDYYKNIYISANELPTKGESYKYNITNTTEYQEMINNLTKILKDGMLINNETIPFPITKDESNKFKIYLGSIDPKSLTDKSFIYEKIKYQSTLGTENDNMELNEKVNFIVKLWQKYLHIITMNLSIRGLINKVGSYTTQYSDSEVKTFLEGKLISNDKDIKIEGWLMKMNGTVEKIYPLGEIEIPAAPSNATLDVK